MHLLAVGCALLALAHTCAAVEKLRLCVQDDLSISSCNALERQNSPFKCQRVIDSAECAIKLAEGKADFGVFSADEILITDQFYPIGIQVIAELRDNAKTFDPFEFQSVVVVSKNYTTVHPLNGSDFNPSNGFGKGFGALVGKGLCHPGFSKTQTWNDLVLKYFEQRVMNNVCRDKVTVAENDLINVKDFFKKACRPGKWVPDARLDTELKIRYPELCELCDNREDCSYAKPQKHGHFGALDCLTSGHDRVAYVSLRYLKQYFSMLQSSKNMLDYQFLCKDGSTMPINAESPCAWFKQPWKVMLAKEDKADEIIEKLKTVRQVSFASQSWEETANSILFMSDTPQFFESYTTPMLYLSKAGNTEIPRSECGNNIRWCTVSPMETEKCNWTSAAARTLGIQPSIDCIPANSPFECFDLIAKRIADIITIDSNYGHLARKVYGLSPILFAETKEDKNSFVVAAIREASRRGISSLADVKNSKACFPEYGGIAWLSFIKVAREHGLLPDSCRYAHIVAHLLDGACAPGFIEPNHSQNNMKPKIGEDNLDKLCKLCPFQSNGEQCEANAQNAYFGDKGALECLRIGAGDIAFLEARNIKDYIENGTIDSHKYRVLCKNGTLAEYTGFDVDKACAFSVTIDSEVVSRREDTSQVQDSRLALLKLEDWLGSPGDAKRQVVHIYERFNGTENLLFKDSSIGLVSIDSTVNSVLEYKELFKHVDACSSGQSVTSTLALVFLNFLLAKVI